MSPEQLCPSGLLGSHEQGWPEGSEQVLQTFLLLWFFLNQGKTICDALRSLTVSRIARK